MGLKYIKQRSVGEEYRVTLPEEVQNVLYPDGNYEEEDIFWSVDEEYSDIIISKEMLDEKRSKFNGLLTIHTNGSVSAVVPKRVRNTFNISQGDDLYFLAPEGIESVKRTTFIWTFEKLESVILSAAGENGDENVLGDFPRKPQF